jgi:predicted nucleic acid-binding protein
MICIPMKKLRLYIDTSVIGGCFDKEFSLWSNRLMDDIRQGKFQAVVSTVVAEEVGKAPEHVKDKYMELVGLGAEVLMASVESAMIAEAYASRGILTPKFADDMQHISLATVANVDMVVSWNFKHIVHFDKIRQFNAVNIELGYRELKIHSPMEVASNESEEE